MPVGKKGIAVSLVGLVDYCWSSFSFKVEHKHSSIWAVNEIVCDENRHSVELCWLQIADQMLTFERRYPTPNLVPGYEG